MLEHELQRDVPDRNHDVDSPPPVFTGNVVAKRKRRLFRRKAIRLQVFREVIDRHIGARQQSLSKRRISLCIEPKVFRTPIHGEHGPG